MTILFLCSGNTCRSPMAIAAWRALERSDEKPFGDRVRVRSAGLAALTMVTTRNQQSTFPVVAASRHAQRVARAWGEDLSGHRAHGISTVLLSEADLVVTMTEDQARAIRDYFGRKNQVRALGEWLESESYAVDEDRRLASLLEIESKARPAHDIVDPYGSSLEAYQSCGEEIKLALIGLRRALRDGKFSFETEQL